MSDSPYRIRDFTSDDFEAFARIQRRLTPDQPVSADELRHWLHSLEVPGWYHYLLAAEDPVSGEVVGTGTIHPDLFGFDPDKYWTEFQVDPSHQGRGLGRRLWRRLEGLAGSRHAQALWTGVWANDSRSLRFFERAGFVERQRLWYSRLDLSEIGTGEPEARKGPASTEWTVTTLAEEGATRRDVQERIYRLACEAGEDVPRMVPPRPPPLEQALKLTFGGPGFLPEGFFLARVGHEYVAMTELQTSETEPDTLVIGFTGTLRSYRRRGIASQLKRRAAEFARARGYRYLRTVNDSLNQRIWTINQRLGFRSERTRIHGEKTLSPADTEVKRTAERRTGRTEGGPKAPAGGLFTQSLLPPAMPLYMDVHHKVKGVTRAAVAEAHEKDLKVQAKHGVNYRSYWVDEKNETIFCLVEAPNPEAAHRVHREAHGLVADEVHEVHEG